MGTPYMEDWRIMARDSQTALEHYYGVVTAFPRLPLRNPPMMPLPRKLLRTHSLEMLLL